MADHRLLSVQRLVDIDSVILPKSNVSLIRAIYGKNDKNKTLDNQSIEFWVNNLIGLIATGKSLHTIHRIIDVLAKLEENQKYIDDSDDEEEVEYSHHSREGRTYIPKLRPVKYKDGICYVENVFLIKFMNILSYHLNPSEFNLESIIRCTSTSDFTPIFSTPLPDDSPLTSFVDPLFLTILNIALLASPDFDQRKRIYEALIAYRNKNSFSLFGNTLYKLADAVLTRRLRFHMVSNEGIDMAWRRSTLYFNEFFEASELDFVQKRRIDKSRRESKKALTDERLERRKRESLTQFEICFERIGLYIGKSPFTVFIHLRFLTSEKEQVAESLVWKGNVQLLNKIIEKLTKGKSESENEAAPINEKKGKSKKSSENFISEFENFARPQEDTQFDLAILEQALQLYTIGFQNLHYLTEEKEPQMANWFLPLANKATSNILKYINTINIVSDMSTPLAQKMFPKCLLFLGAAFAVNNTSDENSDEIFGIFTNAMKFYPDEFVKSEHYGVLLTSISHFMVGLEGQALQDTLGNLIHLWNVILSKQTLSEIEQKHTTDKPLLELVEGHDLGMAETLVEHGLLLLQLMQYVFNQKFSRAMMSIDDMEKIVEELRNSYFQSYNQVAKLLSVYAITGFLSAMQSLTVEFPRSENSLKTLRQLVLSSINFSKKSYAESLLPHQGDPMYPVWKQSKIVWKRTVGIACAYCLVPSTFSENSLNFRLKYPPLTDYQRDIVDAKSNIVEVLLNDILGIFWVFDDLRCGFKGTLAKIEAHKKSRLFRTPILVFIKAISNAFLSSNADSQLRIDTLNKMRSFAEKLHNEWRVYFLTISTTNEKNNSENELLTRSLIPIFQSISMTFTNILKPISDFLEGKEVMTALDAVGYLNFLRVDFPAYQVIFSHIYHVIQKETMNNLIKSLIDDKDSQYITGTLSLINKSNFSEKEKIKDEIQLNRTYFLMSVAEKIVHKAPSEYVQQELVPLLFMGIQHSNTSINKYSHLIFQVIFGNNLQDSEKMSPAYIKISLENYPEKTPIDTFKATTVSITKGMPEELNYVSLYCLRAIYNVAFSSTGEKRTNLCMILFSCIPVVNLQLLDSLLEMSKSLLLTSNNDKENLKKYLYNTIAGNFDYARKNTCLKWFLEVARETEGNTNTTQAKL